MAAVLHLDDRGLRKELLGSCRKPELIRMASAYLDESDFAGNMCRLVYTEASKLPEDHEVSGWIAEICATRTRRPS